MDSQWQPTRKQNIDENIHKTLMTHIDTGVQPINYKNSPDDGGVGVNSSLGLDRARR